MLTGSRILVTGGTGSFGQKFVQMTLDKYNPKQIIIYSRDEMKQWEMALKFKHNQKLKFVIGDIRDYQSLFKVLHGIDFVVHAAATKIVPTAETNPAECVKTNIIGAMNLIDACINSGIKKVVSLSTDKASNPINLYGASKLASDKLFVAANNIAGGHQTRFSVVRYGNVVGSRGSVIHTFNQIIKSGSSSIPITDKNMTRFWITLQQGVDFVLKNFTRMYGGEIFIPKIPSITIEDLAKSMAPGLDLDYIGIRPGEKIHEIMCPSDDSHLTLEFHDHFVIQPTIQTSDNFNFVKNNINEEGKLVDPGFCYDSGANEHFLSVDEITELNKRLGYV